MEAASAAPGPAKKSRDVLISPLWIAVAVVGSLVAVGGLFLKAFNLSAGDTYSGTNNMWSAVNGGKGVLVCCVITLIFLFGAWRAERRGILWGAYIFALITLLFAVTGALGGFKATDAAGNTVTLHAAIGPIVVMIGSAVLFLSLLIARFTEKRV